MASRKLPGAVFGMVLGTWATLMAGCASTPMTTPPSVRAPLGHAVPVPPEFLQARVRDPNAGFFDLAARRALLAGPQSPRLRAAIPPRRECGVADAPPPPPGPMQIPRRYLSPPPGRGPINPEQAKRAQPYWTLEDLVASAATQYAVYGDARTAQCLVATLDAWAQAEAMLDYNARAWSQSWYTVEWTATSAALALSVVRSEPKLDTAALQRATDWLDRVARKQLSHVPGEGSAVNNHAYWRGLMAASVGVVAADDELFRQGLALYATGIAQISADGSLPHEMQRGENALHYQNYAVLPLVGIAEVASRQGVDLYGYRVQQRSLANAVDFLLAALDDPALVRRHSTDAQNAIETGDFAWMEFWQRRHPDARIQRRLVEPLFQRRLGGNATVYAAER